MNTTNYHITELPHGRHADLKHADLKHADAAVRVIFVEDDDLYRDAVDAELRDAGFAVHSFRDGPTMLAAVGDGLQADVVVLDWGLDQTSGLDLLIQLRARGLGWPIVFLTNRSTPTHEKLALERGASDFIDKARGVPVLVTRLRVVANHPQVAPSAVSDDIVRCGRLTLRLRVSRAYWDDVDVCLTVAEFKIVRLLVGNVGSFITYRQIYDCMHRVGFLAGSGEDGYRANVRSTIRRIRNKFKALSPEFSEIRTYTSFGYCWGNMQTS